MSQNEYTTTHIEQAHQVLTELARQPKARFTMQELIAELLEPLQNALKLHTYEEVASGLKSSCGIEIKASTLKQYVTRCARSHQSIHAVPDPRPSTTSTSGKRKQRQSRAF
ncbi:hypothetical protein IQ268_16860 [Oculatella sp. LEGE 06141]|uniref:hypothetical protein n=1 Tax=Oculatella sp. LEGE 06141 TaxID=1828648 RepID=UPI0018830B1E|nr:hypothetical protein [Oculatella sp. LEGE 06141]MBE9180236.1 hypothetical protein [Oculatella sp. LEGE 06141]